MNITLWSDMWTNVQWTLHCDQACVWILYNEHHTKHIWWSDVCVQEIHWTSRDTLTTSRSLVVVRFSLQKKHVRARAYNAPLSDCTWVWAWENETVAHTLACNESKSLLKIKLKSCCFDVFQVHLTRDRADRDLEHLRRQHFVWE